MRLKANNTPSQRPCDLITRKNYTALRSPYVVLEVVLNAASIAHTTAGYNDQS